MKLEDPRAGRILLGGRDLREVPSEEVRRTVTLVPSDPLLLHGTVGNGPSSRPFLSGDGRWVAFVSLADDLVPGDGNGLRDCFVARNVLAPIQGPGPQRVGSVVDRESARRSGVP